MSDAARELGGRCLCGQASYLVRGEPVAVGHCYCRTCQRLSGAGHSTAAMFPTSSIEIRGKLSEYSFESSPGVVDERLFCATCGSHLFARNGAAPHLLSLTLGTLDEVDAFRPQIAIYVKQKADWDLVDDRIRNLDGTAVGVVDLPK